MGAFFFGSRAPSPGGEALGFADRPRGRGALSEVANPFGVRREQPNEVLPAQQAEYRIAWPD